MNENPKCSLCRGPCQRFFVGPDAPEGHHREKDGIGLEEMARSIGKPIGFVGGGSLHSTVAEARAADELHPSP